MAQALDLGVQAASAGAGWNAQERHRGHAGELTDCLELAQVFFSALAVEFDAPTVADARRELARRIRPLDPRPVRGGSLLLPLL